MMSYTLHILIPPFVGCAAWVKDNISQIHNPQGDDLANVPSDLHPSDKELAEKIIKLAGE